MIQWDVPLYDVPLVCWSIHRQIFCRALRAIHTCIIMWLHDFSNNRRSSSYTNNRVIFLGKTAVISSWESDVVLYTWNVAGWCGDWTHLLLSVPWSGPTSTSCHRSQIIIFHIQTTSSFLKNEWSTFCAKTVPAKFWKRDEVIESLKTYDVSY